MKEMGQPYNSFGPLRPFVGDLCAVLYRLLPVVGLRIHTRERAGQGELTLVFLLREPEALPSVEFLHTLVEALRRTPFGVAYRVVTHRRGDCLRRYAASFYVTARYPLGSKTGRSA